MPRPYKTGSKRIINRSPNGRFRKTTMLDFGLGGFCDVCGHIKIRHYDGNDSDPFIDPRLFRYRCFTCEPRNTEENQRHKAAIEKEKEGNRAFFNKIMEIINE